MVLTLNAILKRLRTLALSHEQVNNFYFGEVPEFDIKGGEGDVQYPCIFVEMQPGVVDRAAHLTRFKFRIYVLDLVGVSEGTEENETDVLSDTVAIFQDYLSMLMFSDYQNDWIIADTSNFTQITEGLGDMVAGVVGDVEIATDFLADRCQVPADDTTFENDIDMSRTKIVTYTGGISETNVVTVTGLAGKTVLAAYRAGAYKRAITSVPTDFDSIKITGTDLGSYKGIISYDGTATLQTGDALVPGEVLDFLVWSN